MPESVLHFARFSIGHLLHWMFAKIKVLGSQRTGQTLENLALFATLTNSIGELQLSAEAIPNHASRSAIGSFMIWS